MPELPEVEVLAQHLAPLLKGKTIHGALVRRRRTIAPATEDEFATALKGASFTGLTRRGKYLLFALRKNSAAFTLVGHLGMTGRMYLASKSTPLPKHSPVVLDLGHENFVFQDTRYFGKLTLDTGAVERLGPEPLSAEFTAQTFADGLKRSQQSIKVKLLDQALVAGIGNIYASEALFRAGISPGTPSRKLNAAQVKALHRTIREVLTRAVRCGSSIPLDFAGETQDPDRLFYYGAVGKAAKFCKERFWVYGREGKPCLECGDAVRRIVQGARSTFLCGRCQPKPGKIS